MSRRFLSSAILVALAMAVMLAWTGHAYSLAVPTQVAAQEAGNMKHGHDHGEASWSCAHCTDHYHAPLTPDHQHETPQLSSAAQLTPIFGRPCHWPGQATRYHTRLSSESNAHLVLLLLPDPGRFAALDHCKKD